MKFTLPIISLSLISALLLLAGNSSDAKIEAPLTEQKQRRLQLHAGERVYVPRSGAIEAVGSGVGWPVYSKIRAASWRQQEHPYAGSFAETRKGRGGRWPRVGEYGDVPRMNQDLVNDEELNKAPCKEDPISIECTGGFGGGIKSTGGPMNTRVFWRRDNTLGWQQEMDGPVDTSPDLQDAHDLMYGFPRDRRMGLTKLES